MYMLLVFGFIFLFLFSMGYYFRKLDSFRAKLSVGDKAYVIVNGTKHKVEISDIVGQMVYVITTDTEIVFNKKVHISEIYPLNLWKLK